MSIDTIGNMLTSIRNVCALGKKFTTVPHSKFKEGILATLKKSGYIKDFQVLSDENSFGKKIKIFLKYIDGEAVIHSLERVSTPGLRVYNKPSCLKPIVGGLGISVVSTNKGILTDIEARKLSVGGEVILKVW